MRTLILGAVLTAAVAGVAAATVVNEAALWSEPKSGGAARLQCRQHGPRIIDEAGLRDAAVNFFDGSNSLHFRQSAKAANSPLRR